MKKQNSYVVVAILIIILLFTSIVPKEVEKTIIEIEKPVQSNQTKIYGIVKLKVPAVDDEGNGVVTYLVVEAREGKGKLLTDINNLLFWIDTQYSIQVAERVAQNITKINLTNIDLIYSIETEAQLIEGPSAGAALTIATIAAVENKTIEDNVMITGTINPDGSIGEVGGIAAKSKAAKDVGATLFLVPYGQGYERTYKPVQQCKQIGSITWCTTEYKVESINVTKDVGIKIIEVKNIEEALKYFILA